MVARLKGNNAVLNVKFASNFFLCMRKSTFILSMCLSNAQPVVCQSFLIFFGNVRHACASVSKLPCTCLVRALNKYFVVHVCVWTMLNA